MALGRKEEEGEEEREEEKEKLFDWRTLRIEGVSEAAMNGSPPVAD